MDWTVEQLKGEIAGAIVRLREGRIEQVIEALEMVLNDDELVKRAYDEMIEDEDWVLWNGGVKPDLHGDTIVDVKLRMNETLLRGTIREFGWQHGEKGEWDIIAYRVIE
mgnify:CR=1 FL=1